ncbi:MAG: winged helix-turn-helix transcriptional regulator [Proteobacteria bacterium]|nr:winged helix-turn-helix transcriptional regulator [Pseudomonadota bacterium]
MTSFQSTRKYVEQKLMVDLLSEIERNPSFTQRGLASELGIALGLMNQYLKHCVTKGWVRATQVSPRRIAYFLTPTGFSEKSTMVAGYLARSMTFFRDARSQCKEIFELCALQNWKNIALLGDGDLADIARLVLQGSDFVVKIVSIDEDFKQYDAILVTDAMNPQKTYDAVKNKIDSNRLLTIKLLHISREKS